MSGRRDYPPRLRRSTTPALAWVPSLLGLLLLAGPLLALAAAANWPQLPGLLARPEALQSLGLSLGTASVSTLACLVLGTPLALLLSRLRGTVLQLMRAVVLVPLVLSPVVSGLALLHFWGRRGTVGGWLDAAGLGVGFSPAAVVLVQVFVALPFFVIAALSSIEAVDPELELSAATSGANAWQVVRYITLPLAAPGLVVGTLLSFARALGEYGATITFAGSVAGRTRTLPLQIELALNSNDPQSALGISLMLVALYLLVLGAARLGADRVLPR